MLAPRAARAASLACGLHRGVAGFAPRQLSSRLLADSSVAGSSRFMARFAPMSVTASSASRRNFAAAAGSAEAVDLDELRAKIAELQEQMGELEEKRKHIQADSRQAQKRHANDLENETKYGITKFAREILKVADNLERASASVKQEDLDKDKQLRKMNAGVQQIRKKVSGALTDYGVNIMKAEGEIFNPDKHEAMFMMEMPGKDPNTIFHVMEPGYTIHDRTLRAAKVGVVRG